MPSEAIILAGGLGTRLRDTVPDLPKCMAPVNGKPIIYYVINQLRREGIERIIFSLGYKHDTIEKYLEEEFPTLDYECAIESEPLGTGGAIQACCKLVKKQNVVVANGDTLYKASLSAARSMHDSKKADCTLLLKPMKKFDRYGVVEIDEHNRIIRFREKAYFESGHINGGLYILNVKSFLDEKLPKKFSFEKDYLESYYPMRRFYGCSDDGYFIDIGIAEDYHRAQDELKRQPVDLAMIDQEWTLFLDRDGVINYEKKDDYIRNWGEFKFYPEATEAISKLSGKFGKIIVVSNQRGVGKGLMSEADLHHIHETMKSEIESQGGRIDGIYYCTSTDNKHPNRKPNPGMAFCALNQVPGIDLSKSIIAGNKTSDMLFGRNAGIYTAFIASTNPEIPYPNPLIDLHFNSLIDFAKAL